MARDTSVLSFVATNTVFYAARACAIGAIMAVLSIVIWTVLGPMHVHDMPIMAIFKSSLSGAYFALLFGTLPAVASGAVLSLSLIAMPFIERNPYLRIAVALTVGWAVTFALLHYAFQLNQGLTNWAVPGHPAVLALFGAFIGAVAGYAEPRRGRARAI
jgi:hypothetical protein